MAPNLSIYAIPVYWVMAMWPHVYAVGILKANKTTLDNANPRGTALNTKIQKAIPADAYARYERAESAHKNLLENSPLFIGAVIVGNFAELNNFTMNTAVGVYLALRASYIALYLNTTTRRNSFIRTLNWAASLGVLFTVFIKAGNKLAYKNY